MAGVMDFEQRSELFDTTVDIFYTCTNPGSECMSTDKTSLQQGCSMAVKANEALQCCRTGNEERNKVFHWGSNTQTLACSCDVHRQRSPVQCNACPVHFWH
jgi:hypothetical protein